MTFFDQSPQTVLNGLVCLAKLHSKLFKRLILNIKIILQRRRILISPKRLKPKNIKNVEHRTVRPLNFFVILLPLNPAIFFCSYCYIHIILYFCTNGKYYQVSVIGEQLRVGFIMNNLNFPWEHPS